MFWRLHSLGGRGLFVPQLGNGKCWLAETIGADEARSSITTYFHSYPFVPGGAVSLPPPLLNSINNAAAAAITPGLVGHLFAGQQACNIGCTCTCTNIANCNPHHHQHHHHHQQQQHHHHHQQQQQQQHHHRPLAATTVLLQPVEHIKDTMVSATNFLSRATMNAVVEDCSSKRSSVRPRFEEERKSVGSLNFTRTREFVIRKEFSFFSNG